MYFNTDKFGIMKCTDVFTKKNRSEWDVFRSSIKSVEYIDKYFTDIFTINKYPFDNWKGYKCTKILLANTGKSKQHIVLTLKYNKPEADFFYYYHLYLLSVIPPFPPNI